MEMWMSWCAFLAIAGAAYWYYTQNNRATPRGRSTTRSSFSSTAKAPIQWSDSESKSKAAPKAAKAKTARKSVKPTREPTKAEAYLSTASSTGGADADDDLSPIASPAVAPVANPSGRDVSDMLSPKAAAASVLSIKPSEKPSRTTKAQAPKAEVQQETKKQRQNKKKNEEAKAAREEAEKARQVLAENQRRTAREARGEPAKNGLQSANVPASNAWTTVGSRGGAVQPPAPASAGQLLDTFDAASTASSSDAPTNGTAQTPNSYDGLPSEEEQLRLAMEDSAWTTVPKAGKKQRKAEDAPEESTASVPVQAPQPVKPIRPTQALNPENKKPSSRYQILSEPYTPQSAGDSDWPVM